MLTPGKMGERQGRMHPGTEIPTGYGTCVQAKKKKKKIVSVQAKHLCLDLEVTMRGAIRHIQGII